MISRKWYEKFYIDGPDDIDLNKCPSGTMTQIETVRNFLTDETKFHPDSSTTDNIVKPTRTGTTGTSLPAAAGTETIFTSNPPDPSQQVVNVIEISGGFNTSSTCTKIKLVGNANSIFVLRKSSNSELSFGGSSSHCGVQVVLEGVDPNNVIWAINANVKWNAVSSDPDKHHKMVGTFLIDSTGSPKWETVNFEGGGRILGPNGVPSGSNFVNTKIYAIASNGQPSLVPVLQIHSPEGSPGNTLAQGSADIQDKWLQAAGEDTKVNAAFVSGNSPSRPAEESAGLHNFVRFLENWSGRTLNIKGSFVQFKRSTYATAPFATVLTSRATSTNALYNNDELSIFGYRFTQYKTGNGEPDGILPYYTAPTRQWGFDVGILSQPPDLFAQKVTSQPVTPPDEFFREVGRDEPWIQPLLCAAHKSDPSDPSSSYIPAVDPSQRSGCPFDPSTSTAYND